jgi:GNAT superfamily N-acetyltransferase
LREKEIIMTFLGETILNWKHWLPMMPLFVVRRKPGMHWTARNGTDITLRIVNESDGDSIQAFVRGLSVKSRYRRYFYPVHELPPEQLERALNADPAREVTLLATAEEKGKEIVIGMAQYVVTGESRGEFAVVVADAWQGNGIGKSLLYALTWLARSAGIVWLDGDVLIENAPMRGMLASLNFTVRPHPEDDNLVKATRRLSMPERKCSRLKAFLTKVGVAPVGRSPSYS